ncbi:hypothetical protein AXF42_Ash008884 [Apostasia shenzhenica]|uniref:Uncharacterized protein n=1 Tax=Apostasia shenzhenica TaxID=1088818 RepID=A0A2I0AST7_9ASPA|nr:hypothetical protein AXF42_Ash008884 [Apostasia shenzhenica]
MFFKLGRLGFSFYSDNSTLDVPKLQDDFDGLLTTNLALHLQPKRFSKAIAIARLRGKPILCNGKYILTSLKQPVDLSSKQILWGSVDVVRLLVALKEMGYDGLIELDRNVASENDTQLIRIRLSDNAVIECSGSKTLICSRDDAMASSIFEAICSVCDGI